MTNLAYSTGTPDPTIFRFGMTGNNRSPYDRWRYDGDYSKLDYVMADQVHEITEIGFATDHAVAKVFLKDPEITRLKEETGIRSPEIYRCAKGWDYFYRATTRAIKEVTGQAKPRRAEINPRPYQQAYADQYASTTGDFLLAAKCRAGKVVMSMLGFTKAGDQSVLMVSFRKSASNSWFSDPKNFTIFGEWAVVDLHDKDFPQQIKDAQEDGKRVLMIGTVQQFDKRLSTRNKLRKAFPNGIDTLALDECHIGGESNSVKNLRKAINFKRVLEISGTAHKASIRFHKDNTFVWDYVQEQQAKNAGYDWAISLPTMKLTVVKYNAELLSQVYSNDEGATDPDRLNNLWLIDKKTGKFVNESLVRNFFTTYFTSGSQIRWQRQLFHGSTHMIMSLTGAAQCREATRIFNSLGLKWKALDVTGASGEDQASIRKFISKNPAGTICFTRWANVVGVTIPEWDTVVHGCVTESLESYVQLTFRGGSTPNDTWRVIDFAPEQMVSAMVEMVQCANPNPAENKQTITIEDFAELTAFATSLESISYEDFVGLAHKDAGNVIAVERRRLMYWCQAGDSLDETWLDLGEAGGFNVSHLKNSKVGEQQINTNDTQDLKATHGELIESNGNAWAAQMACIKAAIASFSDVVFLEYLSGNSLSSLKDLLQSHMLKRLTGASKEDFERALKTNWIYGPGLDRSIKRISYAVQVTVCAS